MTNDTLPRILLVRHGETAWSLTGQHTGRCDIPLTERGESNARQVGIRLKGQTFAKVLVSPLQRAMRTCELAGFKDAAEVDSNLLEWDYGEFEGRRTIEIQRQRPGWDLFRDGCPGGESADQVGTRADLVIRRVRKFDGNVLLFSSAHLLRVLAARWLGLDPGQAHSFALDTASFSMLVYEHDQSRPVIWLWNDTHHLIKDAFPDSQTTA